MVGQSKKEVIRVCDCPRKSNKSVWKAWDSTSTEKKLNARSEDFKFSSKTLKYKIFKIT
jgi:hypothetical protein